MSDGALRPDFSLRLADHFPLVAPPCKEAAARFFFCFTENSQQKPGETAFNIAAGRLGLAMCEKDMRVYDACMQGALAKKA